MVRFNTPYDRVRQPPEVNPGGSNVDRAGYISAHKRIENIMYAGQRLVQSRREMYDFEGDEIDEDFNDPTRSKNYDMADAFQADLAAKERIAKAHRDKLVQEASLKASQTAPEPLEGGSGQ